MKRLAVWVSVLVVGTVLWHAHPMGDEKAIGKEPAFASLEEGEENIEGVIIDDGKQTEVKELSFFGYDTVGGIRNEDDDSMTKFDLTKIKSIKIVSQKYESKRYPEKDFCMVTKVAINGAESKGMLVPSNIIICGIDKKTGDEKSWSLHKISELQVIGRQLGQKMSDALVSDAMSKQDEKSAQLPPVRPVAVPEQTSAQSAHEKKHESHEHAKPKAVARDVHKEVVFKVIESKGEDKSFLVALRELLNACVEVIKSLFNAVKKLF